MTAPTPTYAVPQIVMIPRLAPSPGNRLVRLRLRGVGYTPRFRGSFVRIQSGDRRRAAEKGVRANACIFNSNETNVKRFN